VLGGGPAGSSAARLLASWGHQVELVTRPTREHQLAVSLPPSCAKLFDAIGVSDAIERAGFIRSTGNTVWWGHEDARVEPFAEGARGWQVDLGPLESVLLEEASRAGVTIERRVLRPTESGMRRITKAEAPPAFVLDCTGRSGLIARARNLRRFDDGPTTVALAGEWRSDAWELPDVTHTVVESYADGWMWSVPTADGIRHVAAMIDPQRSDLARGGSSRDVYLSEIGKTRAFKRLLATASLASGPSGWDASTYGAREYAGDDWLLVGDAASFIDPLSSAGVKKALASAWLAAVAVHTGLKTPSMRRHALDFYGAREREIERHHAAESRAFLANAARRHGRPFWADRSDDPHDTKGDAEEVRRAFELLKHEPAFTVVVPPAIRIEPRPLVDGHEIVMAPHVVPSNAPAVRYLHGVDLVQLLELAPTVSQVPDLFELYARRAGPVPLHDFLLALSTAVARGWLVSE